MEQTDVQLPENYKQKIYMFLKSKFSVLRKNNNENLILPNKNNGIDDISLQIIYDKINKKCKINEDTFIDGINKIYTIYRSDEHSQLASMFMNTYLTHFILTDIFGDYETSSRYLWTYYLVHDETKSCIKLYSSSNVFEPLDPFCSIITPYDSIEQTPKSLVNDLIELLSFICNYQYSYKNEWKKEIQKEWKQFF